MRTQENKEKYKEYDHKYYIKNRRPRTKIGQLELQIDQLKQQLAEKDIRIEELEGQFAYECECNKQFVQLQNMWNELKEWVSFTQPENINDEFISGACSAYSNVIDKMQELEGEDE